MALMASGADKLRAAERQAKEARKRRWRDWTPGVAASLTGKEKEFTGLVMEVVNADALVLKLATGTYKKVFLASIRPPRSVNNR
jgi:staphylococcal nuclease domain-containing protein 1